MSFFRDRRAQYIYRATSSDDGVTWSKPTKTKLPNNNSGIQATVLMSGHIAIVYNPTNHIRYNTNQFSHSIISEKPMWSATGTCTMSTHSFEIICHGWKVGLADHVMRSFYK